MEFTPYRIIFLFALISLQATGQGGSVLSPPPKPANDCDVFYPMGRHMGMKFKEVSVTTLITRDTTVEPIQVSDGPPAYWKKFLNYKDSIINGKIFDSKVISQFDADGYLLIKKTINFQGVLDDSTVYVTDGNGHRTRVVYYAGGTFPKGLEKIMLETSRYDDHGRMLVDSEVGYITTSEVKEKPDDWSDRYYHYDSNGNTLAEMIYTNTDTSLDYYTYNTLGRVVSHREFDNGWKYYYYTYNANGDIVQEITIDAENDTTTIKRQYNKPHTLAGEKHYENGDYNERVTYVYLSQGYIKTEKTFFIGDDSTFVGGTKTITHYNSESQPLSITESMHKEEISHYSNMKDAYHMAKKTELDDTAAVTPRNNILNEKKITVYKYDANGNCLFVQRSGDAGMGANYKEENEYDANSNLVKHVEYGSDFSKPEKTDTYTYSHDGFYVREHIEKTPYGVTTSHYGPDGRKLEIFTQGQGKNTKQETYEYKE